MVIDEFMIRFVQEKIKTQMIYIMLYELSLILHMLVSQQFNPCPAEPGHTLPLQTV